ncbi:MAG: preprotein translocase subunit SecA [Holosporaceae bacterium]|jgi:preprotein translocase subunit SecA|nr:preprotein translocase subunit SecA [Holosporaceae bacterium]
MLDFLKSIFGSHNDRIVKRHLKVAGEINALEESIAQLSDDQLREKTVLFKNRLAEGETLDDILPEAFAVAREGAKRALGLRPFDVQMVGAMVLHNGMVAEMKTGEGKTLVASIAVYLNALEGKGVHLVTVNDYLASRDAEWMGRIYRFLGLSVGVIIHGLTDAQRREQYACDVTYATNNELGFDYLRDNMKFYASELVMRPFHYAIVDEVDSILIDEARTPLIISGAAEDSADLYMKMSAVIPQLFKEDFEVDEKHRNATLTELGNEHIEKILREIGLLQTGNLYDMQNIALVHHVAQALKANTLFKRDVDYIVKGGKVIIIDEFTGRMMEGRRYSDGLHQAIEAKEKVKIEMENQTLASITFQNFFRMYKKLSGMTGTAATEAQELSEIYNVETVVIPTNLVVARQDLDDEVYRTAREKYEAIIALIRDCVARRQPVLVGTVSIEKSELLSSLLNEAGIAHNVLNARYHDVEAQIIAEAGKPGAITIATNMAGRGTDIKLGGNLEARLARELADVEDQELIDQRRNAIATEIEKDSEVVKNAGGLYVIGTERHESRRIDNQLRGRSGRQGDPGASKFFLSLEDDLMRIFGAEKLDAMLQKLGIEEGEAIVHPWVNKALEKAQMRVEARNYDIRKHLLKFDDVMNDQRKVIYTQRHDLMSEEADLSEDINEMRRDLIAKIIYDAVPENAPYEFWDLQAINEKLAEFFGGNISFEKDGIALEKDGIALEKDANMSREEAIESIYESVIKKMAEKEALYSPAMMRYMERTVLLRMIDQYWKEHLLNLDRVRQGINLRAYAQRDPLNEYKQEAFSLFENMSDTIRAEAVKVLSLFEPGGFRRNEELLNLLLSQNAEGDEGEWNGEGESEEDTLSKLERLVSKLEKSKLENPTKLFPDSDDAGSTPVPPRSIPDGETAPLSRNALCPCGSGKRYKNCCGKIS